MNAPRPPTGHELGDARDVATPALLFYPERIVENIRRMLRMAGSASRLRPHVKTHKSPDVVALHRDFGITKYKCATVAEAEMLAACGAGDVLVAMQPAGPNARRLVELGLQYPDTVFSAVADSPDAAAAAGAAARGAGTVLGIWLDVDCGMGRTGVGFGAAGPVYRALASTPGLVVRGLHVYDGHINDSDLAGRRERCEAAWAEVERLRHTLTGDGLAVPDVVAGGTPTFPFHAGRRGVECSPGTTVLWDAGYARRLPDLEFLHAAFLLTRVVSKPGEGRLCFDLGHKAVAAENPLPKRAQFVGAGDIVPVSHSEEHLVVDAARAGSFAVGDVAYALPWHVCPTVALYDFAEAVVDGQVTGRWRVAARSRAISV